MLRSLPWKEDVEAEFARLQAEGMNAMQAMWKASKAAHRKRKLKQLKVAGEQRAQGAFAASAMAMYRDAGSGREGEAGSSGAFDVVRVQAPDRSGFAEDTRPGKDGCPRRREQTLTCVVHFPFRLLGDPRRRARVAGASSIMGAGSRGAPAPVGVPCSPRGVDVTYVPVVSPRFGSSGSSVTGRVWLGAAASSTWGRAACGAEPFLALFGTRQGMPPPGTETPPSILRDRWGAPRRGGPLRPELARPRFPPVRSVVAALSQVRTGDASLAAPFTSKKPSVSAVLDLIRQGRYKGGAPFDDRRS